MRYQIFAVLGQALILIGMMLTVLLHPVLSFWWFVSYTKWGRPEKWWFLLAATGGFVGLVGIVVMCTLRVASPAWLLATFGGGVSYLGGLVLFTHLTKACRQKYRSRRAALS